MKTTLHYIIAILLFSLNAAYVFAEVVGPFKNIDKDGSVNCAYDHVNNLLTISGEGTLTITGDGTSVVEAGIVITDKVKVTIKDLHLRATTPLVFADNNKGEYSFICQGTNILESTGDNEPGMNLNNNQVIITGNGSLKVIGGSNAAGIKGRNLYPSGESENGTFIVAIGGKGASSGISVSEDFQIGGGLLISGKQQDDDSIEHVKFYMYLNFTLGVDAEIPSWAEVTIEYMYSLTVPEGITLTNNGTITNNGTFTNNGDLANNGTLTTDGKYQGTGTLTGTQPLTIGGKDGFDVSGNQATFSYDDVKKLLTIGGSGAVLIEGRNKAVNCGIVLANDHDIILTIKDLHIQAAASLKVEKMKNGTSPSLNLEGTNILESTANESPGIEVEGQEFTINGPGSLTAIGGEVVGGNKENGKGIKMGTDGNLCIKNNAFVVFINGKGSGSGPDVKEIENPNGFLISGTKREASSISRDNFSISEEFILGVDAEIPSWAWGTFKDGESLTIPSGFTLTNSGAITNNGTITNNGRLLNRGTLTGKAVIGNAPEHLITFNANYSTSPADEERYIPQGEALPTDLFSRADYTFDGWYDAADGGTAVSASTEPQTLYARWKADEKPVEPDPPYVPIYYNVYLPQVEGVTLDPGPGEYEVESWNTFRFYLTLDSAYSESQPIVTTDRGETLQPRSSDGAYLVKYVRTDVEVFIDGIVQNPPPVANEVIAPADALAPQIWAEGSMLCIRMPEALPSAPVRIFTVDGRLHDRFASTPGLNRRQLPTGMYIVRIGETACKVIVK